MLALMLGVLTATPFSSAYGAEGHFPSGSAAQYPPPGNSIRFPVTRDTFISSVGDEKTGNNGGADRLKVKGNQEYTLIDIDPAALKGKIITGACLHVRSASPEKAPLARLGVSSVASPWMEGTSYWYWPQAGSACYDQAAYKKRNWAYPGSTLMDAVFGRGNTVWRFADCTPPDQDGWQTCAVSPEVVAARVAGISHGFCLYDEVGSTWSIESGRFHYTYFPNRYLYSRESGGSGPWLEVWTKGTDETPPDPITSIAATTKSLPGGEAILEWKTPADRGGGETIGFLGTYTSGGRTGAMPQYLLPMVGTAGQTVRMHLQDLSMRSGQEVSLSIRPVDTAGNIGPGYTQRIRVSAGTKLPNPGSIKAPVFKTARPSATVGNVKVSVIDLLDKINPQNGRFIPQKGGHNRNLTHLFCAKENKIRLYCARNETVCFQLELEGAGRQISIQSGFDHHRGIKTRLYQFGYVKTEGSDVPLPDPLVPLTGPLSIPSSAGKVRVRNQRYHSVVCEVYVPKGELPGGKARYH